MDNMYQFEVVCKNIVIEHCKNKYNEDFQIQDIHVVWINKTLQNKKAIIIDSGNNNRMYELTFNGDTKDLYFDEYEKISNASLNIFDVSFAKYYNIK